MARKLWELILLSALFVFISNVRELRRISDVVESTFDLAVFMACVAWFNMLDGPRWKGNR